MAHPALPRGKRCRIPRLADSGLAASRFEWVPVSGWDLSHVLLPKQRALGWRLYVRGARRGQPQYIAFLVKRGVVQGMAYALCRMEERVVETHAYPMERRYRGQGFGRAMYEAILGAAYHNRKLCTVRGVAGCSDSAHLVHLRLIEKYGCVKVRMDDWKRRGYEYTFPK